MTTYYVSKEAGASDSNPGTSPSFPKLTYGGANALAVRDDTVLGRGGDVFRETVIAVTGVQYNAYGNGQPAITGCNIIASGWTDTGSNRWAATVNTQPRHVFFNGIHGTLVASVPAIVAAGQWFWAANTLTVFSTSDPATAFNPLGLEAAQRNNCIWDNNAVVNDVTIRNTICYGANTNPITCAATSFRWTVENCIVRDSGFQSTGIYLIGSFCKIRYNTVTGIDWHGVFPASFQGLAEYNFISDCKDAALTFGAGVYMSGDGSISRYNTISKCYIGHVVRQNNGYAAYNLILDSLVIGIHMSEDWSGGPGCRIAHNVVRHNPTQSFHAGIALIAPGDGFLWQNNIVYSTGGNNTGRNYLVRAGATQFTLDYNLSFNTPDSSSHLYRYDVTEIDTLAGWKSALNGTTYGGKAAHDLQTDPLFVNQGAGNFQLQGGSPCRDAGVVIPNINDGLGGSTRYQGSAPDIGAYEYYPGFINTIYLPAPAGLRIIGLTSQFTGSAGTITVGPNSTSEVQLVLPAKIGTANAPSWATGDCLVVSPHVSNMSAGLMWNSYASSTKTVVLRVANVSASTATVASSVIWSFMGFARIT